MSELDSILIGGAPAQQRLLLRLANRHGLITGATGTGKTVTLQTLAEGFSSAGVPVFVADVKGDLAGLSQPGSGKPALIERAAAMGVDDHRPQPYPVEFWDLFGEQGTPVRATVCDLGPLLLARLLELNDTQEGVLNVVFAVADDQGLLLLDLPDLRAMLSHVADNAAALAMAYGGVSRASVGAIQRRLLLLEREGGNLLFGEPALDIHDLMRCTGEGRGYINILAADRLMRSPRLYATFLLWLLSELFEELPEVGDLERPRLGFFFDEAHLLFDDAPKALLDRVEQVVRLIRSKGVGVYFVTQNPADVPQTVLGQLGNRVQHALRAFTPRDRQAVRAAAQTFRPNPALDTEQVITELEVGEALVSTLHGRGTPSRVERTLVRPPQSRMGPVSAGERRALLAGSALRERYGELIDRHSAHEILAQRAASAAEAPAPRVGRRYQGSTDGSQPAPRRPSPRQRQGLLETMARSALRAVGTQLGRQVARGLLGGLFRGR